MQLKPISPRRARFAQSTLVSSTPAQGNDNLQALFLAEIKLDLFLMGAN